MVHDERRSGLRPRLPDIRDRRRHAATLERPHAATRKRHYAAARKRHYAATHKRHYAATHKRHYAATHKRRRRQRCTRQPCPDAAPAGARRLNSSGTLRSREEARSRYAAVATPAETRRRRSVSAPGAVSFGAPAAGAQTLGVGQPWGSWLRR